MWGIINRRNRRVGRTPADARSHLKDWKGISLRINAGIFEYIRSIVRDIGTTDGEIQEPIAVEVHWKGFGPKPDGEIDGEPRVVVLDPFETWICFGG